MPAPLAPAQGPLLCSASAEAVQGQTSFLQAAPHLSLGPPGRPLRTGLLHVSPPHTGHRRAQEWYVFRPESKSHCIDEAREVRSEVPKASAGPARTGSLKPGACQPATEPVGDRAAPLPEPREGSVPPWAPVTSSSALTLCRGGPAGWMGWARGPLPSPHPRVALCPLPG